jgi:hypothetical protein
MDGLCIKCHAKPINGADDELCSECLADYRDYMTELAIDREIDRQIDEAKEEGK